MMYQALYRKYRSQTFTELVGQEVVATALRQAVATGKISHAYLFSGPRGTGKTSVAKIFAKAMNCPNQVDGEPCNDCPICDGITKGNLEDVIEIDAASHNGVDDVRDIRDKSTYAPSLATYKVYIIDEVHMLSTGAFNALLKTLEEPTDQVVFLLATTELHKIPATILSRLQRFEFKAIPLGIIQTHLATILEREGLTYEPQALALIARRAEGGMRDALSILDQALTLVPDGHLTTAVAEEVTGAVSSQALGDYVTSLRLGDGLAALAHLGKIYDSGRSMSRFAGDLLLYLRDLLIVQAGGEDTHQTEAFSANLSLPQDRLFHMIDQVTASLSDLKQGSQPKIYAEMMTLSLVEQPSAPALPTGLVEEVEQLRAQVAQLREAIKTLSQAPTPPSPVVRDRPKPPSAVKVDQTKILTIMQETVVHSQQSRAYLDALKGAWQEILDSLSPQNRALLLGSEPVLANAEHAILAFEAAFNAEQAMKRSDLNEMVGNIMSKVAGFSPKVLAVPRAEFNRLRADFAKQMKTSAQEMAEPEEEVLAIPEGFDFLAEKLTIKED